MNQLELEIAIESVVSELKSNSGHSAPKELKSWQENQANWRQIYAALKARCFIIEPQNPTDNSLTLTSYGWSFESFEKEREQQYDISKHKELEKTKVWYETENAKTSYEDFPNVKRNAAWALGVAIFVAFLELIKWIVELLKSSTAH